MSYTISIPPTHRSDLNEAIVAARDQAIDHMDEATQVAAREHLGSISRAAQEIAENLGRPGDLIAMTISGHANPAHAPTDGWADEMVTLSMSVVIPAPPAEVPDEAGDAPPAEV